MLCTARTRPGGAVNVIAWLHLALFLLSSSNIGRGDALPSSDSHFVSGAEGSLMQRRSHRAWIDRGRGERTGRALLDMRGGGGDVDVGTVDGTGKEHRRVEDKDGKKVERKGGHSVKEESGKDREERKGNGAKVDAHDVPIEPLEKEGEGDYDCIIDDSEGPDIAADSDLATGNDTDDVSRRRESDAKQHSDEPPTSTPSSSSGDAAMENLVSARARAKAQKDRAEARRIRDVMTQRAEEYLEDLRELRREIDDNDANDDKKRRAPPQPPHPNRVLHSVARKVPAIQNSPDILLRIQSARADPDAGLAAYGIGLVARTAELHDKMFGDGPVEEEDKGNRGKGSTTVTSSRSDEIVSDRRFEQLVECVLCGVDVKHRLRELKMLQMETDASLELERMKKEDSIDNEEAETRREGHPKSEKMRSSGTGESIGDSETHERAIKPGMDVSDISRAAWGIAVLGGHHLPMIGGENPKDILVALSLQCRELLLSRLHALRWCKGITAKTLHGDNQGSVEMEVLLLEKGLAEIARDAASAMWAFSCVKACTGVRSDYLFDACVSVLCQREEPLLLAKKGIKDELLADAGDVGSDDATGDIAEDGEKRRGLDNVEGERDEVVSEEIIVNVSATGKELSEGLNRTERQSLKEDATEVACVRHVDTIHASDHEGRVGATRQTNAVGTDHTIQLSSQGTLLDKLTPKELTNALWAFALHAEGSNVQQSASRSSTVARVVREFSSRVSVLLRHDLKRLQTPARDVGARESIQDVKNNDLDVALASRAETLFALADDVDSAIEDKALPSEIVRTEHINASFGGENFDGSHRETEAAYSDASSLGVVGSTVTHKNENGDGKLEVETRIAKKGQIKSKTNKTAVNSASVNNDLLAEEAASGSTSTANALFPETIQDEDGEIARVVDAAALLAAESALGATNENEVVGDTTERGDDVKSTITVDIPCPETMQDRDGGTVEVVDAAALVAAEGALGDLSETREDAIFAADDNNSITAKKNSIKVEVKERSSNHHEKIIIHEAETSEKEKISQAASSGRAPPPQMSSQPDEISGVIKDPDIGCAQLSFSVRDICAIAWALTELRDPSVNDVMKTIVSMFSNMGHDATLTMEGGDLSNLAWSIAKSLEDLVLRSADRKGAVAELFAIILKLAEQACSCGASTFEPPELSRMMWSLSLVASLNRLYGNDSNEEALSSLALKAVEACKNDLSAFTAEDLSRIVWAFTELCDTSNGSMLQMNTAKALGQIYATIEASLLRWESGHTNLPVKDDTEEISESLRFTPVFGKSRLSLQLLEQNLEDDLDEDDESQLLRSPSNIPSLPSLRDLSVDPATLCKLCYGLSCMCPYPSRIGGTLVRIATRLFSSKNGRLLRECSSHDIVRLTCACFILLQKADVELSCEDRDFILRHFVRRLVQRVNESVTAIEEVQMSLLETLSPVELATFLFALGELGVHCGSEDEKHAHRRLRLVVRKPNLSSGQLMDLPGTIVAKMLCGIVKLGDISNDVALLFRVLWDLSSKLSCLGSNDYCRIALSLAKMKQMIEQHDSFSNKSLLSSEEGAQESSTNEDSNLQNASIDAPENDTMEEIVSTFEKNEAEADNIIDRLTHGLNTPENIQEFHSQCNRALSLVAEEAAEKVSEFTANHLRRFLMVYVLMPCQADAFIKAAEHEINQRLAALDATFTIKDSMQDVVQDIADCSVCTVAAITALLPERGPSNPFTKGMKALFASSEQKNDEKEADDNLEALSNLVGITGRLNNAAASAREVASLMEKVNVGAKANVDLLAQEVGSEAAFELGRCRELVAAYKRLEFKTGIRRSRYDEARRQRIGKRILSRLLHI